MATKSLYIGNFDCKDLVISSMYKVYRRRKFGYTLKKRNGDYNPKKFSAAFDYSLDQLKLQEVCEEIDDVDFSFTCNGKNYTTTVINVTFKYAVRDWNCSGGSTYVKLGMCERDVKFNDFTYVKDGELQAIVLDQPISGKPIDDSLLQPYFEYRDGKYCQVKNFKTVHSVADCRKILYEKGFNCNGVHYIRWKRSAGASRSGKCLFIDERLYSKMHEWEMCGLDVKDGDPVDLAALECYTALTLSSIEGMLEIHPENFLVIDDYNSIFTDEVISVEEHDGKISAERKECEISNCIWDGQGLISPDLMGIYADKGMVLLRNRMFKSCCFNCNIQQWFADNGITDVSQLNGSTRATRIEDIKLIVTPSSIKYLKFGSLDQWLDNLEPAFGMVKTEKQTHFLDGRMVQAHYQLLNSIQMTYEEVEEFLEPMLSYMTMIKEYPAALRYQVKYPIDDSMNFVSTALSKNDIVFKMLGVTDRFAETKLYYDFRSDLLKSMTKNIRLGHVLVNGNYSTLFGNPVEMLLAAIGKFDGTSQIGVGNVHSTRFEYDKILIGSRSPHICASNVWIPCNRENPEIDKYFNLTPEILCVNSINDNVLNRLSGCDFDSDTVLLTDNKVLIKAALRNQNKFPIAVVNIDSRKVKRTYTIAQKCDLDVKTSKNLIGEVINLSQRLNSLLWDTLNSGGSIDDVQELYLDICILNALSGLEIDAAKKEFNVNRLNELKALKKKYSAEQDGRHVLPNFFAAKDKGKGYYDPKHNAYIKHQTSMDYLQTIINVYRFNRKVKKDGEFLEFSELVTTDDYNIHNVWTGKVDRILNLIRRMQADMKAIYGDTNLDTEQKFLLAMNRRQECIEYIGKLSMTHNTMIYLLHSIELEKNRDIRASIFNVLFGYPNTTFYSLILRSKNPVPLLVEDSENGTVEIFGYKFAEVYTGNLDNISQNSSTAKNGLGKSELLTP